MGAHTDCMGAHIASTHVVCVVLFFFSFISTCGVVVIENFLGLNLHGT